MKLNKIAQTINAYHSTPLPSVEIQRLLTDSRSLTFPEGTLFFALVSKRNDGHRYIPELYGRGVRHFVVSTLPPEAEQMPEANFLTVPDTLAALQQTAAAQRSQYNIPVIGITGSNGKTIVKEWLHRLLAADYRIVRSPRSYNSQIGVPLSVWALDMQSRLAIFEAGISRPGEMEKLQLIIRPTIGIFTNLGTAHAEGFSGQKQKAVEKLKLFTDADLLIYNNDNKLLDIAVAQAELKGELFSWGRSADSRVRLLSVEKNSDSTIRLQYKGAEQEYRIPFTDDAFIENAMHAICTLLYLGQSAEEIAPKLLQLEPVAMRLELKQGINQLQIINDTYNSDLNSLDIALSFMQQQNSRSDLPQSLILSDIEQSGMLPKELYTEVARLVHAAGIDRFIAVGEQLSAHKELFSCRKMHFFRHTDELLHDPLLRTLSDEILLLKGARRYHFEEILSRLELTLHQTTLDVNLQAFVNNFNYFRSILPAGTKMMSVVKAFGYGSGSVEIARALQNNRCDYLAVALADEGAELRREDIRLPIVVMNPEKSAFDTIFKHRLEPEIYSFRLLQDFTAAAEKEGLTDYPIHIKIDTGMHRFGFGEEDIEPLSALLKGQNTLKLRSLFTHLVASENPAFDDYTHKQMECFTAAADSISEHFSHRILRHALNSAGIERFPEYALDMARLGIGLYNVSALPGVELENVSTLKTVILQIRNLPAGETIGYGRKGKLTRDSRIGVLPIGYADGYNRLLGNGLGEVWINGHRAKTVGNICMDATMIDLTGIPAAEGDSVEIFGDNITITELAEKLNTIPYEILTSISRRVRRVYFLE